MVYLRVFCLFVLSLFSFASFGQSESFDFSALLKLDENHSSKLDLPPQNDSIEQYLGNLLGLTRNSTILLSDLQFLIKESDKVVHENKGLEKYDYLIHLIEAIVMNSLGRYDLFQETITRLKKDLANEGRENEIIKVNIEVAHFLNTIGKHKEAVAFFYENELKASQYKLESLPHYDPLLLIINGNSFGLDFENQGQLDSAMKYLRIGLNRAMAVNSRPWIGLISGNLGALYAKIGKFEEAEKFLLTDLEVSYRDGEINSAVLATLSLIDLKLNARDLEAAKDLLNKLRNMEPMLHKDDYNFAGVYEVETNKRFGRYHMLNGQPDLADSYMRLAFDRLEKISNSNREEVNKFINKRYALEDHVANLTTYKEKSTRNKYIIFLVGSMLIAAIFVLYNQRKFNQKLKEKNKEIEVQAINLADLNQQKSKLFSIVAHDIKSPLNNLKSLLEMHKEQVIDQAEFQVYSNKINQSLNGLSGMLQNILNWSRLSIQHGITVNNKPLLVEPLFKELLEQSESLFDSKKLLVKINIDYQGQIMADPEFLRVIIRNLVSNAIKFSNEGGTIELAITNASKDGFAMLKVSDTGVGMLPEQVSNLFAQTKQGMSTKGTAGETGTGLGLTICKDFAVAMGTNIEVVSEPNKGCSFDIIFAKA